MKPFPHSLLGHAVMIVLAGLAAPGRAGPDALARIPSTGTLADRGAGCSDLGGGFLQYFVPNRYEFDAHSGPAGENPRGTVNLSTGERRACRQPGHVSCLAVNGNRASIGVNFAGLSFGDQRRLQRSSSSRTSEARPRTGSPCRTSPAGTLRPSTCPADLPQALTTARPLQFGSVDWHVVVTDDGPATAHLEGPVQERRLARTSPASRTRGTASASSRRAAGTTPQAEAWTLSDLGRRGRPNPSSRSRPPEKFWGAVFLASDETRMNRPRSEKNRICQPW